MSTQADSEHKFIGIYAGFDEIYFGFHPRWLVSNTHWAAENNTAIDIGRVWVGGVLSAAVMNHCVIMLFGPAFDSGWPLKWNML